MRRAKLFETCGERANEVSTCSEWPALSEREYDRLLKIEEVIRTGLNDLGIVDGHDIGSGEMNVFIHTNTPELAFRKVKLLLTESKEFENLKAGYRCFDNDDYTPLYPTGLERFAVI